jgi:hypothetical protein
MIVRELFGAGFSAATGLAVLVLLAFYCIEYGTWLDEAGPLRASPPTFILPFALGGLGVVLLIGGLIVGIAGTTQLAQPRP